MARKHFSPSALPAAETPFYIDAASVSARGDAQCVWSHESSISSSYARKHGSVCASCIVPGCCAQVALCKLLHASGSTSVFKLFCAWCSVQVSLRKKLGACIRAQDAQPELSCGGAPRTIRLRFRVAIFRSEPPGVHSTYMFVLLEPELPRTREESNPRPRDCEDATARAL